VRGRATRLTAKVTVIATERASVKLVMPRDTVTLVVTVVGEPCRAVRLLSAGDGPPTKENIVATQTCSDATAIFEDVPAGSYRACPGAATCTPITVTAAPPKQTVEVRAVVHP